LPGYEPWLKIKPTEASYTLATGVSSKEEKRAVDYSKSRVKDWMTQEPMTVDPETSAVEAYERMRDRKIRRLPVVGADAQLVGIITRSDIEATVSFSHTSSGWSDARFALAGTTVGEIMTREPFTVSPQNSMRETAKMLLDHRLSGLPVVEDGKLVGIITETDVFRLVVELCKEG
jgi:acetoin utilization protein AcuB